MMRLSCLLLLRKDVAEDAALFHPVVLARRTQFIQDTARNKRGGDDLRGGVVELLSGMAAEILDDADVLEAAILLEVVDTLSAKRQVLLDLAVVGVPQLAVVAGILDDDLVRADRLHGVVQAVARAAGLAFDPVNGMGMDDRARRPRIAIHRRHRGDHLQLLARLRAEGAEIIAAAVVVGLVAGDDPGAGDGILAQFHRAVTLRC